MPDTARILEETEDKNLSAIELGCTKKKRDSGMGKEGGWGTGEEEQNSMIQKYRRNEITGGRSFYST